MTRVLGIDPGLRVTGFGVIEKDGPCAQVMTLFGQLAQGLGSGVALGAPQLQGVVLNPTGLGVVLANFLLR